MERPDLANAVRSLLREAKLRHGTWEKVSQITGISLKSLYRYWKPKNGAKPLLPSLETYEILCRSVGRHCYPEEDDDDASFFTRAHDRYGGMRIVSYLSTCRLDAGMLQLIQFRSRKRKRRNGAMQRKEFYTIGPF